MKEKYKFYIIKTEAMDKMEFHFIIKNDRTSKQNNRGVEFESINSHLE